MHNMRKTWFANDKFSLWKSWFTISRLPKMLFCNFCLFHFSKFQMKKSYGRTILFIMDFEGFYKVLIRHKCFWSSYFWQWNNVPFKIFWNFHGNTFCFFIFVLWKKYCNLSLDDRFKTWCCVLCQSKCKLHK